MMLLTTLFLSLSAHAAEPASGSYVCAQTLNNAAYVEPVLNKLGCDHTKPFTVSTNEGAAVVCCTKL